MLRYAAPIVVAALLLLHPASLPGQAAPAANCLGEPAAHALDFWLGSWTVQIQGRTVGTNRIATMLGGCAIAESWRASDGSEGRSLFYYLPVHREWRQIWVTAGAMQPGGVKEKGLVEVLPDGVRFQGTIDLPQGGSYLDRTTLTRQPGGTVRQLIEYSTNGGGTWQPTFDALYTKDTPAVRAGSLESLTWRPAGQGVEVALAEGNPSVEGGRFTMLLRFADGGWMPPHWHNVEKVLIVVSGELLLGEGDRLDPAVTRRFGPGSTIVIPAEQRHFEGGAGPAVVAMVASGPFRTTMVMRTRSDGPDPLR